MTNGESSSAPPAASVAVTPALAEVTPALTEEEWQEMFFQRGQVTAVAEGNGLLLVCSTDAGGDVKSVALQGDACRAVGATALYRDPVGLDWQDHDHLVLMGMLLEWYVCGIPLETRPQVVQGALPALRERHSALISRLAALLPPR